MGGLHLTVGFLKCCFFFWGGVLATTFMKTFKNQILEAMKKLFPSWKHKFFTKYNNQQQDIDQLFYQNFDTIVIEKHGKHFNVSEISINSFQELFKTKILVIGVGGLGSVAILYLSKFGFDEIGLMDGDVVELSNLHRQIIHKEKYVGTNKCISAKYTLEEMVESAKYQYQETEKIKNPKDHKRTKKSIFCDTPSRIVCYPVYLNKDNGFEIIKNYDIVLDCTDNISTRFLINDLCLYYKKKLVFASALGVYGQVNVFNMSDPNSNCYRCLKAFNNHERNSDCDENGILSTVTGVIGILQANEAVKLAAGLKHNILNTYLTFNGLSSMKPFETLNINRKNSNCICSKMDLPMLLSFIQNHNYEKNGANIPDELISSAGCAHETAISNSDAYVPINNDLLSISDEAHGCVNIAAVQYEYDIDAISFCAVLKNNLQFFSFTVNHVRIVDIRKKNNIDTYGLKNTIVWDFYDIIEVLYTYEKTKKKQKNIHIQTNLIKHVFNKLEINSLQGTVVIIVICRKGINSLQVAKLFNVLFFEYNELKKDSNYDKNISNDLDSFQIQKIIAYNMKGGYYHLKKEIYAKLPFL